MIVKLLVVPVLYGILLVFGEVLYHKGVTAILTRKVAHIGGGILSSLLPYFVTLPEAIFIGGIFSLILIWTRRKHLLNSVHQIEEKNMGAVLFPIGLTISACLFWKTNPLIYQGSALLMGLSDGFAGLIGRRFGKLFYSFTGRKTLEGSFTFLITTLAIIIPLIMLMNQPIKISKVIIGAIILTFVEGAIGKGFDNLFVPIVGGYILFILGT